MQTPLSGKLYFGGKAILRGQRFTASFPPLPDVPREKRDILTYQNNFHINLELFSFSFHEKRDVLTFQNYFQTISIIFNFSTNILPDVPREKQDIRTYQNYFQINLELFSILFQNIVRDLPRKTRLC